MANGEDMGFADYWSGVSFIQHRRLFVAGIDPSLFYGVHGPFKRDERGSLPAAASTVHMTSAISEQVKRWIDLLRSAAGIFVSSLIAPALLSPATPLVYMWSGAALAGAPRPGIGGFLDVFF